jgi:eukaryotic-like serine/threonine-protein kinase
MIASATCPNGHLLAGDATVADGQPPPRDLTTCPVCGVALNGDRTVAHTPSEDDAPGTMADPTYAEEQAMDATLVIPGSGRAVAPGYTLLAELGRGGMGVVYKARQIGLNRTVALKMILAGSHAGSAELARFRTEAEAIARLQHPNIIHVYEIGEHAGLPYFSLEYCDGGSLDKKLKGTPLPPREAARLVQALALGIQAAHEKGILHRDLKPANVLLTKDGVPKITDFGLARKIDEAGLTASGAILGTPSYMAPEQAGGKTKEICPATDVYGLGAILYECLTGKAPFKAATLVETLQLVLKNEAASAVSLNPRVPRDLAAVVEKCLEKNPKQRYPTSAELARDLGRVLAGEPVHARRATGPERLLKWARRHPTAAALIVVSAAAFLSLLVGGWWSAASLGAAAEREADQRRRAEAHLAKAVEAVERMLTEVGAVELADVPHLGPVRKKLLLDAKAFYDAFLQERADDPAFRFFAGRAFSRLGDIQAMLEESTPAERSYQQARELLEGPAAEAEQRRELGRVLNNLGVLLKGLVGRTSESERALQEALALRLRVAEESSGNAEDRQAVAASYYNLGTVLARLPGQRKRAQEAYAKASTIQEALAAAQPDQLDFQRDRARTLNNLGILLSTSDSKAAEQELLRAMAVYETVVAKHPGVPGYQRELAKSCNNLANLLRGRGRVQPAEETYERARKLLHRLVLDFQTVPIYRQELAGVYGNLGLLFDETARPDEAFEAYGEALTLRQTLAENLPQVADYQDGLAKAHLDLGSSLERRYRLVEAERHYRQAVALMRSIASVGARPLYHSDQGLALNHLAHLLRRRAALRDPVLGLTLVLQPAADPLSCTGVCLQARSALTEAQAQLQQAFASQSYAWQLDKTDTRVFERLRRHWSERVEVLLDMGDYKAATVATMEPLATWGAASDVYVQAARLMVKAIPLAQADVSLTMGQKTQTVERYALSAVELLRQSVDKGFANPGQWRADPEFAPLLQRPDFKRLVDQPEPNKVFTG